MVLKSLFRKDRFSLGNLHIMRVKFKNIGNNTEVFFLLKYGIFFILNTLFFIMTLYSLIDLRPLQYRPAITGHMLICASATNSSDLYILELQVI